MKRKKCTFDSVEKMMIATADENKYSAYRCDVHRTFMQQREGADGICHYCKKQCEEIENITDLRKQFKKELGV